MVQVFLFLFQLGILRLLCFWLGCFLWLLLNFFLLLGLGGGDILHRLFYELNLAEDGFDLGLIDEGLEVPGDVRVLGSEDGVESRFEYGNEEGGDMDVGEGDSLADEEGACA